MGTLHVRFLEGWAPAMAPSYSTVTGLGKSCRPYTQYVSGINDTSACIEQNPFMVLKGNCNCTWTSACDESSREVAVGVLFGLTRAFARESNVQTSAGLAAVNDSNEIGRA